MKYRTYKYDGPHGDFKYESWNKRGSFGNYDDFRIGWERRFGNRAPAWIEYKQIASGTIRERITIEC